MLFVFNSLGYLTVWEISRPSSDFEMKEEKKMSLENKGLFCSWTVDTKSTPGLKCETIQTSPTLFLFGR